MDPPEIIFRDLTQEHVKAAAELVATCFAVGEVTTVALGPKKGMGIDKMRLRAEGLASRSAIDRVGTVAIDSKTGKIVGACLCCVEDHRRLEETSFAFQPPLAKEEDALSDILNQRVPESAEYQKLKEMCPDEFLVLHYIMTAVDSGYEGLGIATRMSEECLKRAKSRGCVFAKVDATGPASRRCYEKLGFIAVGEIKYSEFEWEGKKPFEKITACSSISVLTSRIN